MITIIAALGKNNELGKDNQLLWHLPDDLKRFKKLTLNHPIIMGRKTFESFPKPLPKRMHFVITKDTNYSSPFKNVIICNSIENALEKALQQNESIYIIGGGEIYKQTLNLADALELTIVNANHDADTFFPSLDLNTLKLTYKEFHPKDEKHIYDFEFLKYEKI